jgi:hypothetical protein
LLLLPCAPRNGPLSIPCCLFLCSPSIPEWCEYTHPDQEQTSRTRNHTNTNTTRLLYPHPQSTHTSQHSSLFLSRTHPPRVLDPSSNAPSNKRHCYLVFVPTVGPCCCIVVWSLSLSHLAVAL